MYRFIINKRYVNLLKAIARDGIHDVLDISKETKITYSRMSNIIMQLAKEGIVQKDRLGRGPGKKLDVSITEKGERIIELFNRIEKIMGGDLANNQMKKEMKNER